MVRSENSSVAPSQTLDRGLAALEAVALAPQPISIGEIAEAIGVHRSIAYRLIKTLEHRNLIQCEESGLYRPGIRLATLARSVRLDLRSAAQPEIRFLADGLEMTAFIVIRDGDDATTIESAEPTTSNVHVVYRPGSRHPINRGAPGLALLLGQPPVARERKELSQARKKGWVRTSGEVLTGMSAIAAPIGSVGAVAVMWLTGQKIDESHISSAVVNAARNIEAALF
jgi:DNA-binding IclR family transcriptional regulator